MRRFLAAYKKDWLILTRDRAGLALLFIMPLALTIIMAVIQDAPFKTFQNSSIDVGIALNDSGAYSTQLFDEIKEIESFNIVEFHDKGLEPLDAIQQMQLQAVLIIPHMYDDSLRLSNASRIMHLADAEQEVIAGKKIELVFDPAISPSFRELMKAHCHRVVSKIELQSFLESYSDMFPQLGSSADMSDLLPKESIHIANPSDKGDTDSFNSVQHNVPAYAIFGIFFIALALAGNVIKEREDGSATRLLLIPASPWPMVLGRIAAYQSIAFLQGLLVFLAGLYFMPIIGLPTLEMNGATFSVLLIIIASGFAAAGLGQLLGTYFRSQQQASATGAISIIILAALGGIWVPTFAMPSWMQIVSKASPLNWSMSAFQDVLLRDQSLLDILPELGLLIAFAIICAAASVLKRKRV